MLHEMKNRTQPFDRKYNMLTQEYLDEHYTATQRNRKTSNSRQAMLQSTTQPWYTLPHQMTNKTQLETLIYDFCAATLHTHYTLITPNLNNMQLERTNVDNEHRGTINLTACNTCAQSQDVTKLHFIRPYLTTIKINVCHIKICGKLTNALLLYLLRIFMKQTLSKL